MDLLNIESLESKVEWIKKYQKYVYAFVILATIAQLTQLIIPQFLKYRELKSRLNSYEQTVNRTKQKVMDKVHIEERIKTLQAELLLHQNELFTENEFSEFSLNTLSQIAQKHGNKVYQITYKPTQNSISGVFIFPLQIKMEGDFFGLYSFFKELENYSKIIKIHQFSVNKQQTMTKKFKLVTDFEIQAFVTKEVKP